MNGLLAKLTLRELKKNWFEYLSMLLITLLAVTLFLGFVSNSATLKGRADAYYEEANLADLIVQTSGFSDEDREYFDGLGAQYRIFSDGSFRKEEGTPETVHIYIGEGEINKPYITEGEAGVLVDARVASLRGYSVGDTVTVSCTTLKEAFSARGIEPVFEAQITGLMHSVEGVNIYSVSPLLITEEVFEEKLVGLAKEAFKGLLDVGFITEKYVLDTVHDSIPKLQSQAVLKADDPAALKEQIRARYETKEGLVAVYDHDTMEAVVTIDSEVEQSYNMLYVFPVIFFFVSLLVIMTSVSRLILRERTHIGTFKALGLTNTRITMHYAGFSALVTFIGAAIGAVAGPLIVPTVMSIKYGLMFSMPLLVGIRFSIPWTLGTVALVCLCSFLIGVWASRTVIRENPAECMRPKQTGFRPRAEKKSIGGGNTLLSLRMAVRNIRVGLGRSLMTVVGIAGCSALLLTSFGIGDTLNASVANDFGKLFTFDVIAPTSSAVEAKIEELKGREEYAITHVEEERTYIVSAASATVSRDITLYHVCENSELCNVIGAGFTNALSESVAEDLGVKAGDTLTLTLGGEQAEYTIESIVRTSTWNGFFTTENKFTAEAPAGNFWIATGEADKVRDALNEAAGTASVKTMDDRIAEIENVISSTNTMKFTLMAFAIMLSVVVLYNLSLLNVKERTRDMATMKVLGFTHFRIALSLVLEIMLLTVVGTAIGTALGFPLCMLVMHINEVSVMAFIVTVQPISYFYTVLLSLGTAVLINVLFGVLISSISMTESLKSVE